MKKMSRRDVAAAAVPLLTGLIHLGCGRREEGTTAKSLEYSIDHLRHVDPELLAYDEVTPIDVAADKLRGISAGTRGRVFVAADTALIGFSGNRETHRFDVEAPAGCLAIDEDGDLYVGFDSHVEVWSHEGQRVAAWQPVASEAMITSVALTEDEVLVADAGTKLVHRYDRQGQEIGVIGKKDEDRGISGFIVPSPFFDLAVGSDGFAWVVNPGRQSIENYAPDGSLRSSWGEAGMDIEGFCGCCNPTHLSVLPDGSFVTAEKGLPRVKVYAPTGKLKAVVAGPDQFTEGVVGLDLAVDEMGRILVLDPAQKAIRVFQEKSA
ncbi:MAG: hypothetical protein GY906_40390 [bacterium]|nr:hypothetical protein [bacterium]